MIAIIAKNGMLGSDVVAYCEKNKLNFIAFSSSELDVTREQSFEILNDYKLDIIINCSAYTNVDLAESEVSKAYAINHIGVRNIANYAAERQIKVVHFSTDYVFDGTSDKSYFETDGTNPQTIYGQSKLAGEQELAQITKNYLIIRTSWLYGKHGKNFVETMRMLSDKPEIKVVDDQQGSPTYTVDLVEASFALLNNQQTGIYHVSNAGNCTWYQFARTIMEKLNSTTTVIACTSDEYPTVAKRPKYSVMNTDKINAIYQMPSWQDAVTRYLQEEL